MPAAGSRTRDATSSWDAANVSRLAIASCRRVCSGARQITRRSDGGAKPTKKAATLIVARICDPSDSAESRSTVKTARRSASVIAAVAKARNCIRRRATVDCSRPARHRLTADTTDSTVQCTKKT